MNRKELYAKVKELNLTDLIKKECNKNYTQVSNEVLSCYVVKYSPKTTTKTTKATKSTGDTRLNKLLEVLKKNHILLDSQIAYINS